MAEMILPKGIVFNKESVYAELAKFDIIPLDRILAARHVFSTTSRKLFDPTARRLENFWTRLLGGDRRYLSGATVARLFRHISEEPAFVTLRGPSNRYEPPSPGERIEPAPVPRVSLDRPTRPPEVKKSRGKVKATPPSASKAPHPILKKPRGPSASGPRPTARFASPPGSDGNDDGTRESEVASSGSTVVNQSAESKGSGSSATKEEKKKITGALPKKKTTAFVASTSSSRRRPAMPRRQSSQSGTTGGSETGYKEGSSTLSSKHSGSQGPTPLATEQAAKGSSSATREGGERLSAKAAGKRPAARSLATEKPASSKPNASQTGSSQGRPVAVQEQGVGAKQPKHTTETKGTGSMSETDETKTARSKPTHRRSDPQDRPRRGVPPIISRSRSDTPASPQNLISSSTATISNLTAQGTIIEYDENPPANEALTGVIREQEEDIEPNLRRSSGSVLDNTRFTPTQPSTTPTVPMGRSKSQLSLLLERQGEKRPRR